MTRPALLIIDVMNRFDYPGGARLARRSVAIVPAILRLRTRFDKLGLPVIYANDNFMDWHADFGRLVEACRVQGGESGRIATELAPTPSHYYLLKPKHSAFLGTPLEILLSQLKVERLVLTGIATDSCVLATAQDANMRDFGIEIPSDATEAQTRKRRAQALELLQTSLNARIATSASLMRTLREQASPEPRP